MAHDICLRLDEGVGLPTVTVDCGDNDYTFTVVATGNGAGAIQNALDTAKSLGITHRNGVL